MMNGYYFFCFFNWFSFVFYEKSYIMFSYVFNFLIGLFLVWCYSIEYFWYIDVFKCEFYVFSKCFGICIKRSKDYIVEVDVM